MTYCQLRLGKTQLWLLVSAAIFVSRALSVQVPFELRSFSEVEGGDVIAEGTSLYVSSFDEMAFSASNGSDIIIIEDMTSLAYAENDEDNDDDDTYVFASNYTAYNTVTEEHVEYGSLLFEVPTTLDSFYATSIVGFYRKSGPWVKQAGAEAFLFEGASGSISYESLSQSRDVAISITGNDNGTPFSLSGESTATVLSTDYVSLSSWDTDESSSFDFTFSATTVARDGNQYTGFLRRNDTSEPEDWKTFYGIIRITDTHDSDGDGIPDFSDLGSSAVLGILSTHSISIGANQYWSNDLNTTLSVDPKQFWLYGENIGWFYVPDQDDPYAIRIYIPDERLGWLVTNEEMSPYYSRESDGVSLYFERIDGKISYYDTELEAWFTVNY